MRESLREITVVCQQKQAFTLRVEPADVEKARKLRRQQIENRVARVRIASGRNKSGRLMKRDRHRILKVNEFGIHLDVIALGRLCAEVSANASVDGDAPGRDQFIALSART